jgi:hypothetical protein
MMPATIANFDLTAQVARRRLTLLLFNNYNQSPATQNGTAGFGNILRYKWNISPSGRVVSGEGKEQAMVTNLSGKAQIEDLGNHSTETVAALRGLLAGGASSIADPKRSGFYEIESDLVVYYIHVSPVTGKVLLLATWQNEAVSAGEAS